MGLTVMSTVILAVLLGAVAWVAWWWFIARNRPAFPPLVLDNNDPLMVEARQKAKDSIPQLLELFPSAKENTRVKLPFVSNAGETEYVWAELLSISGADINVRYMTPPVTHAGKLERLHTHPLSDIDDWVVTANPRKYVGGFSMRVMFRRGREQWGDLPPELKAEEAKYG